MRRIAVLTLSAEIKVAEEEMTCTAELDFYESYNGADFYDCWGF